MSVNADAWRDSEYARLAIRLNAEDYASPADYLEALLDLHGRYVEASARLADEDRRIAEARTVFDRALRLDAVSGSVDAQRAMESVLRLGFSLRQAASLFGVSLRKAALVLHHYSVDAEKLAAASERMLDPFPTYRALAREVGLRRGVVWSLARQMGVESELTSTHENPFQRHPLDLTERMRELAGQPHARTVEVVNQLRAEFPGVDVKYHAVRSMQRREQARAETAA